MRYRTIGPALYALFRTPMLVLAALTAFGCGGSTEVVPPPPPPPPPPGQRVTIYSNLWTTLFGNDSLQAEAWAVGPTGDSIPGLHVALSALTPAIATISSTGMVHTHGDGLALFLATTDGFVDTLELTVFVTRVARVVATPDSIGLFVGDGFDLGDQGAPLVVRAYDAYGNEMPGVPIYIDSRDQGIVTTRSYAYEIVARRVGTTVLTLTGDTASTTAVVTVSAKP